MAAPAGKRWQVRCLQCGQDFAQQSQGAPSYCSACGSHRLVIRALRCQCESSHAPEVSAHAAFHGSDESWEPCMNFATDEVTSTYGTFWVCPPCARDLIAAAFYYRRA